MANRLIDATVVGCKDWRHPNYYRALLAQAYAPGAKMVALVRLARRPVMLRWLTGVPIMKAPPCKNNTAAADPAVDLERTTSVGTPQA